MKKLLLSALMAPLAITAMAQTEYWSDVQILTHTYANRISDNGEWIVGESGEGGTVIYNRITKQAIYNAEVDYGRGHVVSDNGWVVGCKLVDNDNTQAIIIKNGQATTPNVFSRSVSGNIHSITPDGSRICGNVGSNGKTSYLPFYCDIDENGNVGQLKYLPFPSTDFFKQGIQYASAISISEDGKTIVGCVIIGRGFFLTYPIIYQQQDNGEWTYTLPSEKFFNYDNLPLPEPVPDMEEVFPDVPYPDPQDYMDPDQYNRYLINGGSPDDYMTPEQIEAYYEAVFTYFDAVEEYNELFEAWDRSFWNIVDHSVFFTQSNLAISPNGKWLLACSYSETIIDEYSSKLAFNPYLYNIETKEWKKFGDPSLQYKANQVLDDGTCLLNIVSNGLIPATSWVYLPGSDEFIPVQEYLLKTNPEYSGWFDEYLTSNIIVGGDYDNPDYSDEPLCVTGLAMLSKDKSVYAAGIDGYVLDRDMYFSFMLDNLQLESGVESIEAEQPSDGVYNVFNLQGVKVLSTKEQSDVKALPAGIYIVNGKKVLLK